MSGASVLEPGAKLGAYVVDAVAEARAFTVVYRAHEALLGRPVSIRALKATVSPSSPYADAIEREAAALAELGHPAFPTLLAFECDADGLYLAVAAVSGPTLEALMAKGKVDSSAASAIALGVADAMVLAHAKGVLHRDLKPRSVRLLGHAVVVDGFDAATSPKRLEPPRALAADASDRRSFAAPEIVAGEAGDARSDVFAIGAMLFAMIAGEPPPRNPPPLAVRVPDVSRPIERVVARCLAEDPRERFDDCAALAKALGLAIAEKTTVPLRELVVTAMAAAQIGDALPIATASLESKPIPDQGPSLREAARQLGIVLALIVAGAIGIESLRADNSEASTAHGSTSPNERGFLRVVARPWAEVFVDGERVETTPFARPIPLVPGRHFVTLKHPRAVEEQRPIQLATGQTVLLDVTMQIDRGPQDAGASDAGEGTP